MKPLRTLAEARTPEGSRLTLHEHDGDILLKLEGRQVMTSTATTSEEDLAVIACKFSAPIPHPRILIGGLGLGFTLRQVLRIVSPVAVVHVAECIPEVIAWNRDLLGPKYRAPLEDPRVTAMAADVVKVIQSANSGKERYDAILLDVDNGPSAMVANGNARLYSRRGIARIMGALKPGGRVAIWSADEDRLFFERLQAGGASVQSFESKSHERAKRAAHRIYLAEKGLSSAPAPREASFETRRQARPHQKREKLAKQP